MKKLNQDNYYFIYKLNDKDKIPYLNQWFVTEKYKEKNNIIVHDEIITFKNVDKNTSYHCYNEMINPIIIFIMCIPNSNLYNMKTQICSIDDASFGIWWNNIKLSDLYKIRKYIINYINSKHIINGEDLLNYCVTLGADTKTKDYN